MKAWRTRHFRELQRAYYAILDMEGFDDIEYGRDTDSTLYLKDDGTRYRLGEGHADLHIGAEAQGVAEAALDRAALFDDPFETDVWRMHTREGLSMDDIADVMKCSTKKVFTRIARIRRRMAAERTWARLRDMRRRLSGQDSDGDS